MAKKFIDAEMLIAELDASCMPIFEKGISGILGDEQSIADVIREQPAADVQEVKHAEWKINCDGYYPYCSNCKQEPHGREMSQYCPHCGCRMDGDTNV